jgi:hypothetical protein
MTSPSVPDYNPSKKDPLPHFIRLRAIEKGKLALSSFSHLAALSLFLLLRSSELSKEASRFATVASTSRRSTHLDKTSLSNTNANGARLLILSTLAPLPSKCLHPIHRRSLPRIKTSLPLRRLRAVPNCIEMGRMPLQRRLRNLQTNPSVATPLPTKPVL